MSNNYSNQVFINCPFDENYRKIFRAIIFTILDCGFIPRCSLESDDATKSRLSYILKLIEQCKYGIHDLSRVELDKLTKLPRFNMPFELGIFHGAKFFGQGLQQDKNCIILEKKEYRYQKFISDIAGIDVTAHNNSLKQVIIVIRNWLATATRRKTIPDSSNIISRHNSFKYRFEKTCKSRNIDSNIMTFVEITHNISDWLNLNQKNHHPIFS